MSLKGSTLIDKSTMMIINYSPILDHNEKKTKYMFKPPSIPELRV